MRKIDSKYSITEDGKLINSENGKELPQDEPLFLFRAKDMLATVALQHYALACTDADIPDEHFIGVATALKEFGKFAIEHADRMTIPGKATT